MNPEIEQFCALARAQRDSACASLIQKALGHKRIFCFGELLDILSIQALKDQADYAKYYKTLELFAFGTYVDYTNNTEEYIELSGQLVQKLRQLTLVSLASKAKNQSIAYALLMRELRVDLVTELEDIIIDGIYLGLFKGKLNQELQSFHVADCIARDVRREDISKMVLQLSRWQNVMQTLQTQLGQDAATAVTISKESANLQNNLQVAVTAAVKNIKEASTECDPRRANSLKRTRYAGRGF